MEPRVLAPDRYAPNPLVLGSTGYNEVELGASPSASLLRQAGFTTLDLARWSTASQ